MIPNSHVHLHDFCNASIFVGRAISVIAGDWEQQRAGIDKVFFYESSTYA